jgi:branched-chain amino acid transport system permease protein
MEAISEKAPTNRELIISRIRAFVAPIPLLAWLLGAIVAVGLEQFVGTSFARAIGLPKVPVLFGLVIMLKKPALIPSALLYVIMFYAIPIGAIARLSAAFLNRLAAKLLDFPALISVIVHIILIYVIFHIWTGMSDYRLLIVKLTMIAVMLTLSLNIINGYMGEFSCSHPGFMALGAYGASVFTVVLFANDRLFGDALLPPAIGPFFFPIALIAGGLLASIGALAVAIPSFRTRGDYLAIISLAFLFIVKSLIENLEVVGGPRGLGSQPDWANLPVVFGITVLCIWIINNFVRSTMGKALNAVRDNEMAADAMTVDTRKTKIIAFLFGAFWAGVAGGLFAHVLRYVNPGTFSLQKLAEVLAMVYFGGLNSVYGSIVGACSISLLGEALRPLELYKWIIIPLLLILVMIYRPTGLVAFKEFDVLKLIQPKKIPQNEV